MPDITPLFSTPIYRDKIFFVDKEKSFINDRLPHLNYQGYDSGNGKTTKEKNFLDRRIFRRIKCEIVEHVKNYAFNVLQLKKINLYITSSWINKHDSGDFAQAHVHCNSIFSGVLYLDVPNENCGKLIFHAPHSLPTFMTSTIFPDVENDNIYNSRSWSMNPVSEDLFIFPSHLLHSVERNNSYQSRFSLSFNCFVKGKVSDVKTMELNI